MDVLNFQKVPLSIPIYKQMAIAYYEINSKEMERKEEVEALEEMEELAVMAHVR